MGLSRQKTGRGGGEPATFRKGINVVSLWVPSECDTWGNTGGGASSTCSDHIRKIVDIAIPIPISNRWLQRR